MPFYPLIATLRSRGWGYTSEQPIDVPFIAGNTTGLVPIVPAAPYRAIIIHNITFNHVRPDKYQVRVWHPEVGDHTVILTADLVEVMFWAYVDDKTPVNVEVTTRTAFPGFLGATVGTVNFMTLEDMLQVRAALEKEAHLAAEDLPQFVVRNGGKR